MYLYFFYYVFIVVTFFIICSLFLCNIPNFLPIYNKIKVKQTISNLHMYIYNYLIIVSQKDIPLHRDFNIYTKNFKNKTKHSN